MKLHNNESGTVSDGFHTFNELYDQRLAYNVALFNLLGCSDSSLKVHKSRKHSDGSIIFNGDYFIVCAELKDGIISNHYHIDYWHLFEIDSYDKSILEYDGHNSEDCVERLLNHFCDCK